MPRGGKRANAGRKKKARTTRSGLIAEAASAEGLTPIEWMLAVLRDPNATDQRRDQMAIQSAPYIHPRLNAVAVSNNYGGGGNGAHSDINITRILAVPRGGRLAPDGAVTIDGDPVTELSSIEPYAGTPGLPAPIAPAPLEPPLPVIEMNEPENVTRLRTRSCASATSRGPRIRCPRSAVDVAQVFATSPFLPTAQATVALVDLASSALSSFVEKRAPSG